LIREQESTDDRLHVRSILPGGAKRLFHLMVVWGFALVVFLLELYGFSVALSDRIDLMAQPRLIAILIMLVGAPVVIAPWALWQGERVDATRLSLTTARFIGPIRTSRQEYDLLDVKGLRIAGPEGSTTSGQDLQHLEFWYKGVTYRFGTTLTAAEKREVIEALFALDAHNRERLGMDTTLGLSNQEVWTASWAREAELRELYSDERFLR